ncbi:Trophoblast glycoprotein-like [Scleropages formosus]|uniref:Trophoblast glycoprotein-like n=1 Tax=Scleropages formosus TaxID=113540 RepID=A0A0P7UPD6_SCLFO|nr:trophoblast glycoprotein-like [Scleropages formosus]KPP76367.1 Trophoblast glycoprotein-like [Scleropages formosus]
MSSLFFQPPANTRTAHVPRKGDSVSHSKMEKRKPWVDYRGNIRSLCITKLLVFWATTTCTQFFLAGAERCPTTCTCEENTRSITCRNLQDSEIPTDLPQWVSTLNLTGNNISTLVREGFSFNATHLELSTLLLSGNNIQSIEEDAFLGLPSLQMLDLSRNRLVSISLHAFHGLLELRYLCLNDTLVDSAAAQVSGALTTGNLPRLQRLDLSGNQLRTIPLDTFETLSSLEALDLTNNSFQTIGKENITKLSEHKAIRVYLAANPFECNCELQSLYFWLKNGSQCVDAHRLLCWEPEGRRGLPIEKLRREDVDCINADLEAVSYVFLGIVLALIGIVFLMVLYLNREGIKTWLNNIREACRDQMEVYHYRYEQDSDPRLANVAV